MHDILFIQFRTRGTKQEAQAAALHRDAAAQLQASGTGTTSLFRAWSTWASVRSPDAASHLVRVLLHQTVPAECAALHRAADSGAAKYARRQRKRAVRGVRDINDINGYLVPAAAPQSSTLIF